ncbi:MAG: glycosyltransferase family 2 protein [Verrucomicrobiaceae bacterium]|nr:glycosyltransferase family 2 protein [Verrucomicrobiaceae bacterium]
MNSIADNPKLVSFDGLFSAIVPCKNEEDMIPIFYENFIAEMAKFQNPNFEIIFIDDGSTDYTLNQLKQLATKDSRVKYISFSRNFGKEAAMYAGFKHAKGDFVAIMDADLQDPPSLLTEMFQKIKDCDCVATRRSTRTNEPPVRSFFARLFYKVLNLLSPLKFKEGARDFRLMRRRVVDEILRMGEVNRFLKGMYEWVGFKTEWIEYENCPRVAGQTKWSLAGLGLYSVEAFTSFSTVPLAIVSVVGLAFCLLSLVAIIFVSIRQLMFHNSAFGWTSMVCILFFLSGLQLFCLGIIGQYMSKIYLETKRRQPYIIQEANIDIPEL